MTYFLKRSEKRPLNLVRRLGTSKNTQLKRQFNELLVRLFGLNMSKKGSIYSEFFKRWPFVVFFGITIGSVSSLAVRVGVADDPRLFLVALTLIAGSIVLWVVNTFSKYNPINYPTDGSLSSSVHKGFFVMLETLIFLIPSTLLFTAEIQLLIMFPESLGVIYQILYGFFFPLFSFFDLFFSLPIFDNHFFYRFCELTLSSAHSIWFGFAFFIRKICINFDWIFQNPNENLKNSYLLYLMLATSYFIFKFSPFIDSRSSLRFYYKLFIKKYFKK